MSYNKITIIGNLGRDPELRYTPQGDAVCDFSVAVNSRKRDKAGEWQDFTTWFKVSLWRRQAENASKYLAKGQKVYIEGRLEVDEWSDRDGKDRYSLVVQGSEMQFLSGRDDESASSSNYAASDNSFAEDSENMPDKPKNTPGASNAPSDDDIPF